MKKYIYLSLLATALVASSCSLETKPYDALTPDELDTSPGGLRAATDGNYGRLKNMASGWHRLQEFPGDNISLSGVTTSHLIYLYNYQRIPTNGFADTFWKDSYQVIVAANKIIESVQTGVSSENDQLIGENYYLRALLHMSLSNVFARPYSHGSNNLGVPIKIDSNPYHHPIRSEVGQVYEQIIKDLLKSIELMNTYKSSVYASKEAAYALLSRVYLYMENNQLAIEYANKVIDSKRFSLLSTAELPDYPTFRPESNRETIFAIKFIPDTDHLGGGWSNIGSIYSTINGVGYGEMYASSSYLNLVQRYPQDVRNKFIAPSYLNNGKTWAIYSDGQAQYVKLDLVKEGDAYYYTSSSGKKEKVNSSKGNSGFEEYTITLNNKEQKVRVENEIDARNGYPKYFMIKCSRQEGQAQLWSPVISRLAELYLIRAEANAKLGNTAEALSDINLIRKRAGIPDQGLYTVNNLPQGQTLMDIVLDERRLELAWEGHRKFDLYRNKRNLKRDYPGIHLTGKDAINEVTWDSKQIVEYIPESQILVHDGLIQNP